MRIGLRWLRDHSLIWELWTVLDAHYDHSALYRYMQRRSGYVLHILAMGALWTLLICRAMSRNYERAIYELIAIAPHNTHLSAGMFIGIGVMHRNVDGRARRLAATVWLFRGMLVLAWLSVRPPVRTEADVMLAFIPIATLWVPMLMLAWLKLYDLTLAPILGLWFAHNFKESNVMPFVAGFTHLLLVFTPAFLVIVTQQQLATTGVVLFYVGSLLNLVLLVLLCELIVRVGWRMLCRTLGITQQDARLVLEANL